MAQSPLQKVIADARHATNPFFLAVKQKAIADERRRLRYNAEHPLRIGKGEQG